jgi:hypothetical protein
MHVPHERPPLFPTDDVKRAIKQLETVQERVGPLALSAIVGYAARQRTGPYWWKGASEICALLSSIGSPAARDALFTILKTDSRIVEFDDVRKMAAHQLVNFRYPEVVSELKKCLGMPNAPVSEISKTIQALGGGAVATPETIIEEGRNIGDPRQAIRHFSLHYKAVSTWPKEKQGGFYYFFGRKVEQVYGTDVARPLFAASLLAYPGPDAASWVAFPGQSKTAGTAAALVQQYPLAMNYVESLESPLKQKPKKKWWQFWN